MSARTSVFPHLPRASTGTCRHNTTSYYHYQLCEHPNLARPGSRRENWTTGEIGAGCFRAHTQTGTGLALTKQSSGTRDQANYGLRMSTMLSCFATCSSTGSSVPVFVTETLDERLKSLRYVSVQHLFTCFISPSKNLAVAFYFYGTDKLCQRADTTGSWPLH